jgi:hypothetical protein
LTWFLALPILVFGRASCLLLSVQTVVIGGHARKVGKTAVMCGLLRSLEPLGWTAVKITQHGHGIHSVDSHEFDGETDEHPFVLREEKDPRGHGDTCRFLAAGARRALWLRLREGQLAQAYPLVAKVLESDRRVMIESDSVLDFLEPSLYLVVLDSSISDFKAAARRFLARADALVAVGPRFHADAWPDIEPRLLQGKPLFRVAAPDDFNPDLSRFVREKISHHVPAPPSPSRA